MAGMSVRNDRGLMLLAMLAISAVGLLGVVASARGDVSPLGAQDYAEEFSVSPATAANRLLEQERGVGIVGSLTDALGGQYAGVWYDNAAGEFVVPVLDADSRGEAARALAGEGLGGDYRFAAARWSWAELESAQVRIDAVLKGQRERALVVTLVDPRTNSVAVRQGAEADRRDKAELQAIAANERIDVDVRPQAAGRLEANPTGCVGEAEICGNPLRGGVRMWPSGTTTCCPPAMCTAGFKATGGGQRYMLTAGHCAENTTYWMSFDDQLQPHYLGYVEQYSSIGDYAKIRSSGTSWDIPSWPSMVAYWGTDKERSISSEAYSYMGQWVCHAGGNSGASCGTVTGQNLTVHQPEGDQYHQTEFQTICAKGGDSGGPVFAANTALGLFTANNVGVEGQNPPYCGEKGYYSEITEATTGLGVSVGTRLSSPPSTPEKPTVETKPASNIQENQVTLEGTVDPNGSSTTYRFEYGKTTSYGSSIPIPESSVGSGTNSVSVSNTISSLPHTRYHYRIAASNAGGTTFGSDQAFTTGIKWTVRNSNSAGGTDLAFWFGVPGEKRVVGDWDGNGTQTPGVYNATTGAWKLRNSNTTGAANISFQYGGGAWKEPVVGDWNNDGIDTIGVYDPAAGNWNLRDSNSAGSPKYSFQYGGDPWSKPVAGDWDGIGADGIGVYDPAAGNWALRHCLCGGNADYSFQYGGGPWSIPMAGDWDGNGTDTIGVVDPTAGNWNLRNSNSGGNPSYSFQHGGSQFVFVVGDWDNNGTMTAGLSYSNAETAIDWNLRNSNSAGNPEIIFESGSSNQEPVTGDWDGDGKTTTGRYEPLPGIWRLRHTLEVGIFPATEFQYGGSQFKPVIGDWNGDGIDTIGLYEPIQGRWELRNSNSAGLANISFQYGGSQFKPVIGDWNNDGIDTIGVYEPIEGRWNLRNSNSAGNPDISFQYGGSQFKPVIGDWNNDGIDTVGLVTW